MLTALIQGNVTFSLVNAKLEYETLQIRDTNYPGNEGEDKQNVQTSVPYATVDQTTHYKLIQGSSTPGQLYKPTGNETDLASYTQTGLAGQQFTASNNRDIPGYKHVAATTDSTQKHLVSLVRVLSVKNWSNFKVEPTTTM